MYSFSSFGELPASVSSDASLVPATEGSNGDHDQITVHASDGDESEPDVSSDWAHVERQGEADMTSPS